MTIDPKEAAASLDDIAATERRTREAMFYAGSSDILILWGVLSLIGNLLNWFRPAWSGYGWLMIDAVGAAGTFAILRNRIPRSKRRAVAIRWGATYLAFLLFGAVWMAELLPLSARQMEAFWPTLVMFGYVLLGIWVGRFFLYCGLAATVLILAGFFWSGDWFPLWMAAVLGGGFIAGGLWLRRSA